MNWQDFLETICYQYNLTPREGQVLRCLPQRPFTNGQSIAKLLRLYNEKYPDEDLQDEALTQRLRGIYKKFDIQGSSSDKLHSLQKKLLGEYQEWTNKYMFFLRVGLDNIHPKFPRETFQNKLKEVIYLPDETSNQVDILQTFAPNLPYYSDQLIECIQNGVPIRILLAWPKSVAAKLREEVLRRYSKDTLVDINIKDEVMRNLETLERVLKAVGKTQLLQIKLYDTLPSLAIYRVGNYLLTGVFLHGELAVNTFQLELNLAASDPIIIAHLTRDFEVLWNLAREFSPNPGTNWRNALEDLF